ncbi:transcriptional regulator, AraC family [Clostridium sp. DL-VIII]|uniref:AraC family transcriptional regulator n=1 Tax=Clostridium sp. DL-VIII TaxID=641107 RepID=UPI00023AFEB1|nr:AraC family transcriptional regulator [Clostridium sp. DL-VIII]EHJ00291.1 transcriptional regulator, AraC family [Clostridium sp. DL-VIII]
MKNNIKFYEKGSIEILHGESNHCFPLHSHEGFYVGAITKGSALFTISNTRCLLKENMIFIVPSNTGIAITTESKYEYITICFKNELGKQVENIRFNKYFIEMKKTEDMWNLCEAFKSSHNEKQFLESILDLISSAIETDSLYVNVPKNETILLIAEYIKKNADKRFDLDELARKFHLSKYHLIRLFKKEMGVTPNQYHIQAKMRILKNYIHDSESKVNLAHNLSLVDQSHLCKQFKKLMGVSIQSYKKNLTKK